MKRLIGIGCIGLGLLIAWVSIGQPGLPSGEKNQGNKMQTEGEIMQHPLVDINHLNIRTSSAQVYVAKTDEEELQVEFKKPESSSASLQVNEQGSMLDIHIHHQWFNPFDWVSRLFSGELFQSEELHVYVPHHYNQSLRLDGSSGRINLESLQDMHELDINISSGRVTIEDASAEQFRFDGSSGSLNVTGMQAEQMDIDISSGRVTLEEVRGGIRGNSSSGSVHIDANQLSHPISWRASSGSITLRLPQSASFELSSRTSSGSVISEFPIQVHSQSNRELNGVVGDGDVPIDLRVSSGRITIEQNHR